MDRNVGAISQSRQENPFGYEPTARIQKSWFDLSNDVKTSFKLGQLVPFLTMETLPGDEIYLDCEIMTRFEIMNYPLLHRVNMKVWYFWVSNNTLWPSDNDTKALEGWQGFISETVPSIVHPYIILDNEFDDLANKDWLMPFLGFPSIHGTEQATWTFKVNALPIAAYLRIYYDFFINPIIQEYAHITCDDGDNTNKDWHVDGGTTQYPQGQHIKYRNWNRDYFTAATPEPQAGDAVQIPLTSNIHDHTEFGGTSTAIVKGPYRWKKHSDDSQLTGSIEQQTVAAYGTGSRVTGGHDSYLDIDETAGTVRQLTEAIATQAFLEKLNRTGNRYRDVTRGFYGEDPMAGVHDTTFFIGSMSSVVQITDVMSTAETTVDAGVTVTPIGAYAGKALGYIGGRGFQFYAKEWGILMGIINVMPRSSYFQGVHKMWLREDKYDYPWPDFAHIGDQEIKDMEVYLDWNAGDTNLRDDTDNNGTFGYQGRYDDWRFRNDTVNGIFATDSDGIQWHLGRIFPGPNAPILTGATLESDDIRYTDVFNVPANADHVYAHIWSKVNVKRALPKRGIPQILG